MSKSVFHLLRLLDAAKDNDDFITKEEIQSNPKNLNLNLGFQLIEIDKMESIYLFDERLNEKEKNELKKLNRKIIDKKNLSLESKIDEIEAKFDFEIIEKSFSCGNIVAKAKSGFILSFIPNPTEQDKLKSNLEIINYKYKKKIEGFYEETISYKYDLMIDDFYDGKLPNCIGIKNDFLQIEKYVKPEFKEYFKHNFINIFEEGKTFFLWDY